MAKPWRLLEYSPESAAMLKYFKHARAEERLDRYQMFGLLAVLAALVAPHAMRFPTWLTVVVLALFAWRTAIVQRQWRTPPSWLLVPLALGLLAGVLRDYHTLLGKTGGVAALTVLVAAKLLETRARRDALMLVYLGYFLVVTNFLFDQSIAFAIYMFAMVLAVTTLLISWHTLSGWGGRWQALLGQVRLGLILMLQALPIMLLLFIFFPRIEGPLWRIPQDRSSGSSGLADSMAPGSFSSMAKNDEVAFRASFGAHQPPQDKLYWRGPVFEEFDGVTWHQSADERVGVPKLQVKGPAISYSMMLEPHQRGWLLALEMPVSMPPDAKLSARLQVVGKPVTKRVRNELAAVFDYRVGLDEDEAVLARNRQLPVKGNARARALGQSWQSLAPRERVYSALRMFRSQGFAYTLQPPLYGDDGIDRFLFEGRQGFCEHFAGSFTYLMRAAGLAARVVGGYQGGDLNGDYLIVRQADAHAWSEVWLAGEGWVRVDPTFEAAPERIEKGLASAVPQDSLPYLMRLDDNMVRKLRLALDTVVNTWNQWVVGYTPERQRQLLKRLGIDDLASGRFLYWFAGLFVALGGGLAGWLFWQMRPPQRDPARREWDRFCTKAARRGFEPAVGEGPRDFVGRVQLGLPGSSVQAGLVLTAYLALRYGNKGALTDLQHAVRQFRP
jgi:transglutaminase-like putative cysteine protease